MKKREKYFGLYLCILLGICILSALPSQKSEAAEPKKQTIMLYIIGSDLEENTGAASSDIEEIMAAYPDTDKYNIVIYTGGSSAWEFNISSDRNQLWEYGEDSFHCVYETEELKNMCDPQTLTDYLDYCANEYPAESYALILWDHGGGPLGGYGRDTQFDDKSMEVREIAQALEDSSISREGRKLSWLGFDACLMGSLEVAHAMSPYAEYMIASEEVEPGMGWDYSFLSDLTSEEITDGEQAGKLISDTYGMYYDTFMSLYPQFTADTTVACLDLSKVQEVTEALENLVLSAQGDLDSGNYAMLARERISAKDFGKSGEQKYDMVDVKNLAEEMQDKYAEESEALIEAVDEMVVNNYSNVEHAEGVSLYYPSSDIVMAAYAFENYDKLDFSEIYSAYVQQYIYEMAQNAKSGQGLTRSATVNETKEQTVELSYELTKEQEENFSSAYFVILESYDAYLNQNDDTKFDYQENGHYFFRYKGSNVEVKDGKLTADYAGESFVLETEGEKTDILANWLEEKDGYDYYETSASLTSYPQKGKEEQFIQGALRFYRNQTTGAITIQGFMPDSEENENGSMISSRGLIRADELGQYKSMDVFMLIRKPQYKEDGTLDATENWKNESGTIFYVLVEDLEEGFSIREEKLDNVKGLYGVFVMTDVWNQVSCSELVEIPSVFKKTKKDEIMAETDGMELAKKLFGMKKEQEEVKMVSTDEGGNYLLYDTEEKTHQMSLEPFPDETEVTGSIRDGELSVDTVSETERVHQRWQFEEWIYEDKTTQQYLEERIADEKEFYQKEQKEEFHRTDFQITDCCKTTVNGREYYWYACSYSYEKGEGTDKKPMEYAEYNIWTKIDDGMYLKTYITEEKYKDTSQKNPNYFEKQVKKYLGHIKEIL